MIKFVAICSAFYTLIVSATAGYYSGASLALSVLLGGVSVLINIAGISYTWRLIFMKKSIALAVLVIIFKYLLLGIVLLSLMNFKWLSPVGFSIGLGSLIFGALSAAILNSTARKTS